LFEGICYELEGRGFETWWIEMYLFLPAALAPGVYLVKESGTYFWGMILCRCVLQTTLPPSLSRLCWQCDVLNISHYYWPPRLFYGDSFSFSICIGKRIIQLETSCFRHCSSQYILVVTPNFIGSENKPKMSILKFVVRLGNYRNKAGCPNSRNFFVTFRLLWSSWLGGGGNLYFIIVVFFSATAACNARNCIVGRLSGRLLNFFSQLQCLCNGS
jgi:hypothetical protein